MNMNADITLGMAIGSSYMLLLIGLGELLFYLGKKSAERKYSKNESKN